MAFGKKNVLSVDPCDYSLGLLGISGVGKTSTIKDYCEILAPQDGGYLFAECGRESGADAIMGISYINCPDWNSDYDEINNSVGFKVLVDDIIQNKEAEYPNLRLLVIDTYDQLIEIADNEILRQYNKEAVAEGKPKAKSIKGAYGGFSRAEDMADDMAIDMLWELKKVGVQFIIIGHVKNRDVTDAVTEQTYTQLTTDMSMRSFNKIKNKIDVLGLAYIDRSLIDVHKKKKANGEYVEVGKVSGETRKISFRDDNYAIDSKSRFANIVSEIPLDGQALVDAITNAIKAEIESKGSTVASVKKENAKADKAKAERAKQESKKARDSRVDAEKNEGLVTKIKESFSNIDTGKRDAIMDYMKEHNIPSFKDVSEVPTSYLETIVGML